MKSRMGRRVVAGVLILAAVLGMAYASFDWILARVARNYLSKFVRAGSMELDGVDVSLTRGDAVIRGVRLHLPSRPGALDISRSVVVLEHLDSTSIRVSARFDRPRIHADLGRLEEWNELINWAAIRETGPVTLTGLRIDSGELALSYREHSDTIEFDVFQPPSEGGHRLIMRGGNASGDFRVTDSGGVSGGVQARITSWVIDATAQLAPGDSWISFSCRAVQSDSFGADSMAVTLIGGRMDTVLLQAETVTIERAGRVFDLSSLSALRYDTGFLASLSSARIRGTPHELANALIHADASTRRLRLSGYLRGRAVAFDLHEIDTPPGWDFEFENLSVSLLSEQLRLPAPISGPASGRGRIGAEGVWELSVRSDTFLIGPPAGQIRTGLSLNASGRDTQLSSMDAVLSLSDSAQASTHVRLESDTLGRPVWRGRLDVPLQPIPDLNLSRFEAASLPFVARGGRTAARLDFWYRTDSDYRLTGEWSIDQASWANTEYAFGIDGATGRIPFDIGPDTTKLNLETAQQGTLNIGRIDFGPYSISNLVLASASSGKKIYLTLNEVGLFEGRVSGKILLTLLPPIRHVVELKFDDLSLQTIMHPYPKYRDALYGRIYGTLNLLSTSAELRGVRGDLDAKVAPSRNETTRVSKQFLVTLGGEMVEEMWTQDYLPYEHGHLTVRMRDGQLSFPTATLVAKSLLRSIKIGSVRGSITVDNFLRTLDNAGRTDDILVETKFGRGGPSKAGK